MALVHLARGKVEAALSAITGALAEEDWDRLARARLLPAGVEIALAAGNAERAATFAEELEVIARTYGTTALEAASQCARAAVQLAAGDASGAATRLRRGWRLWREVEAPYEAARARLLLAQALCAEGDNEGGAAEGRAVGRTFERLGSEPDVGRARTLVHDAESAAAAAKL